MRAGASTRGASGRVRESGLRMCERGRAWGRVCVRVRAEAINESVLAGKLAGARTGVCACTRVSRRCVRERAEGVCGPQVGTDGRSRWGEGNENRKIKKNKKSKIKINK